ncbi:MAG TPA: class I SAM-dependent methyltransferase, partial [Aquifex aeolicus]|nr:class I SAM-dependent methyltransferase [Aquifex aeolicus]
MPQRECARMLVDMVKPRGLVLDLGCGTGFVSSFLPRDCRIVGVDIS